MQGTIPVNTIHAQQAMETGTLTPQMLHRKQVDVIKRAWMDELERMHPIWYVTKNPDYYSRQKMYANFPSHLLRIPTSWMELADGLADMIRVIYHGMLTPFFNLEGWVKYAKGQIRAVYKVYSLSGRWLVNNDENESFVLNGIAYINFLMERGDMPELYRNSQFYSRLTSDDGIRTFSTTNMGIPNDNPTYFICRDSDDVRRWVMTYLHSPCWIVTQIPRESDV